MTQRLTDALATPTVDAMRTRLGGRISDESRSPLLAGSLVTLATAGGKERIGVIVASDEQTAHVYLERGIVKRTTASSVSLHGGEIPADLIVIARQARIFASLVEGQDVLVEREDKTTQAGILREKCRYGALVEIDGGKVLGVGFAKLWPSAATSPKVGAGAN